MTLVIQPSDFLRKQQQPMPIQLAMQAHPHKGTQQTQANKQHPAQI